MLTNILKILSLSLILFKCHCSIREIMRCKYGHENFVQKIIGGGETEIYQYPFMARVEGFRRYCGGALINNLYILTAAHCVMNENISAVDHPSLLRAFLGKHDLHDNDYPIPVSAVFVPEEYRFREERRGYDIALIRLGHFIHFTKYISPICLSFSNVITFKSNITLTAIGWGRNEKNATELHHVDIPSVNIVECTLHEALRSVTQICAGTIGKGICDGDSGGPLVYRRRGKLYLSGITSSYYSECNGQVPSLFTSVAQMLDWIERNTRDAIY